VTGGHFMSQGYGVAVGALLGGNGHLYCHVLPPSHKYFSLTRVLTQLLRLCFAGLASRLRRKLRVRAWRTYTQVFKTIRLCSRNVRSKMGIRFLDQISRNWSMFRIFEFKQGTHKHRLCHIVCELLRWKGGQLALGAEH
jgi:hypothetical protein